jgi:signal transduction histidine kinase
MAASPQPWPELTQLLQRVVALETGLARQYTLLATVRDSQEALHQLMTELRQNLAEEKSFEREAQRVHPFAPLGHLAAGFSHGLRNPLGVVFLHVEVLEEELNQPAAASATQMAESLSEIKTHLMRLDDRMQDYLSLLWLERLEFTPHELGAVVQAWAAEWQTLAEARSMRLEAEGLEHLGTVALHPSTFARAVRLLVLNALEAMPQGGTVTIMGQSTTTHVQLHVRDEGHGIPIERLPQIFDPLYTSKPGGAGLGLYMVQQIVAAHGGHVTVQSIEGRGTTFTIALPHAAVKITLL